MSVGTIFVQHSKNEEPEPIRPTPSLEDFLNNPHCDFALYQQERRISIPLAGFSYIMEPISPDAIFPDLSDLKWDNGFVAVEDDDGNFAGFFTEESLLTAKEEWERHGEARVEVDGEGVATVIRKEEPSDPEGI